MRSGGRPTPHGGMGGFPSPAQHPQAFQGAVRNHFAGLAGQLGGGQPQNDSKLRPVRTPWADSATTGDPNGSSAPAPIQDVGDQQFGTYAPDVDPSQFTNENFKRMGLKGSKKLSDPGGFGMGGLGSFGGMGGGYGGGGGYGQDPMAFMQMLMSLMGQLGGQEDQGPIRGK